MFTKGFKIPGNNAVLYIIKKFLYVESASKITETTQSIFGTGLVLVILYSFLSSKVTMSSLLLWKFNFL